MFQLTEFLFFSVTFLVIFIWIRTSRGQRRYPPSMPSLPLVGSLPFFQKLGNMHEFLMKKADQLGPIFTFRVGGRLWLTLNNRQVIEEALVYNSASFAGREHFYLERISNTKGKGISAKNFSHDFKRYHKLTLSVLKEFGFGVERLMETRIQQEFEAMAAFIHTKNCEEFDPIELTRLCTYNIVKNIVFGKRDDYRNAVDEIPQLFMVLIRNITPAIDIAPALLSLLPYFRRKVKICMESHSRSNNILKAYIENVKKDSKVECFVSRYLAKVEPNFDEEQLLYTVRDLITAGFETTATTLAWILMFVANNSDIQQRLQKEIDAVIPRHRLPSLDDQLKLPFTEATTLEILRLRTVLPLALPHLTLSDSEVCGYFIPAGTKVLVNLYAAHMDPMIWGDPDVFRPERFLDQDNNIIGKDGVIAFSLGRRSCIGEILARQEIFLLFSGLLQQFNIRPGEEGKRIDDKPVVEVTMNPQPFKIRLIPRDM